MEPDAQRCAERIAAKRPRLDYYPSTFALIHKGAIDKAIRQIQEQNTEVTRALTSMDYRAYHADLVRAVQELNKLSSGIMTDLQRTMDQVHRSWFTELGNVASSIQLATMARLTLTDVLYQIAITKPLFEEIDFDFLGKHLNVQLSVISEVQSAMSSLWTSYYGLAESFASIEDFVQLPSFILPEATRGLNVKSQALESLQIRPQPAGDDTSSETTIIEGYDESNDGLSSLLGDIDLALVPIYTGAIESFHGTNPDRERHVLTSLRTLWDEVFRAMAPDGAVTAWIEAQGLPSEKYSHEGRPTRCAKLTYVLRDVNSAPITQYVDASIRAALKLHELFNRVHNTRSGLTQQQLRVVVLNTKVSLEYFIRVWKW